MTVVKKISKVVTMTIVTIMLMIAPLGYHVNEVQAVGVGLIGGATTDSSYENGVLTIGIHGGAAVDIALGKKYYAQVQLPSALGDLLEVDNIRDHIKLKYSLPAPLLGFIPIKGEVKGDNLIFDLDNNIILGEVNIPLNISLAGVFRFTFEIDIAALNRTIPQDTYEFKITVGDTKLDLRLLEFPQSLTTLEFGHEGPDEGGAEPEPEPEPEENIVDQATSNATIVFVPSEEVAPPILDPTDPTNPYEPDPNDLIDPQDNPTGNIGSLTLDYVSSVEFGTHEIEGQTSTYKAEVLRPFIQVSDRRGTGGGWAVTAQASHFEASADEGLEQTLLGSLITLKDGSVISTSQSAPPYAHYNVELVPGGEAAWVVFAEENTGLGTWINRWFPTEEGATLNDNVILEVPGGAASKGKHTSTITWTLIDAPGG